MCRQERAQRRRLHHHHHRLRAGGTRTRTHQEGRGALGIDFAAAAASSTYIHSQEGGCVGAFTCHLYNCLSRWRRSIDVAALFGVCDVMQPHRSRMTISTTPLISPLTHQSNTHSRQVATTSTTQQSKATMSIPGGGKACPQCYVGLCKRHLVREMVMVMVYVMGCDGACVYIGRCTHTHAYTYRAQGTTQMTD